ncbi:MAG: signal peptidase I [Oculatellaceae cyanobacterium bins.114]|nr:signal peptidase I [Oculatellaceae cyanobacterium bins.114]
MTAEQPKSTPPSPDSSLPESTPPSWGARLRENGQILAIALALALIIRLFIAEPRYIPSNSMEPTLHVGDRLVIEKLSYHLRPPKAGEIVVFDPPDPLQTLGFRRDQVFIKRIIGEPGQVVQIHDGTVYVNGEPLQEDYIAAPPDYELPAVKIPEKQFFVMGDNRNNSNDSHVWGFLPQENVIGRAVFRFWEPDRIGVIHSEIGKEKG